MADKSKESAPSVSGGHDPAKDKGAVDLFPAIGVVVCTRNRGALVVATVESLLANTHPNFEVIVVDQSTNDLTREAVSGFLHDQRLRYVRSPTVGQGRSRNIGLKMARAPIVAYTDDDCLVPPNWLETFDKVFREHPRVAVAYSNVLAAEYDRERGFVPEYFRTSDRLTRSLRRSPFTVGIGASMAVRRQAVLAFGGFDPALGPGAIFPSADDRDIAARALIKGWHVYETTEAAVLHDGFRTWDEGKALTERDWFALGAAWAKVLKSGHGQILSFFVHDAFLAGFLRPLKSVFRLKRPRLIRCQYYFWRGFLKALQTPVDRKRIRFAVEEDGL